MSCAQIPIALPIKKAMDLKVPCANDNYLKGITLQFCSVPHYCYVTIMYAN